MAKRKVSRPARELKALGQEMAEMKALIDELVERHMILALNELAPADDIDRMVTAEFRARWAELRGHDTEARRASQAMLDQVVADARRRRRNR